MVALLAISLGILCVGYIVWPFARTARAQPAGWPRSDEPLDGESDEELLRRWSIAAGELGPGASDAA